MRFMLHAFNWLFDDLPASNLKVMEWIRLRYHPEHAEEAAKAILWMKFDTAPQWPSLVIDGFFFGTFAEGITFCA